MVRDDLRAFRLYHKSAELGYAKAMVNLGDLYLSGSAAVDANKEEALVWYRKAAMMDHSSASSKLEELESDGKGARGRRRGSVKALIRSFSRSKSRDRRDGDASSVVSGKSSRSMRSLSRGRKGRGKKSKDDASVTSGMTEKSGKSVRSWRSLSRGRKSKKNVVEDDISLGDESLKSTKSGRSSKSIK
mmetsp:Transcript_42734/g.49984  ORF Transcript_42734/g.49984 Transcript_42734/m.49984 type:complete len:188 (+) Transcript_42734:49-612(+)